MINAAVDRAVDKFATEYNREYWESVLFGCNDSQSVRNAANHILRSYENHKLTRAEAEFIAECLYDAAWELSGGIPSRR